ncbi:Retrovirus-related Pol polyprotein from transposon 17.6 [Nosema granulosis]|uniref:Retrovirus-related Pol polyprotein from transposon 17.6 n=1 Tax=Nosema granulosis TaxID=83296 RepID=A0A9P6GZC6_9MICR|nr:Retrovirus-related Pol polyprotein from transposon 17.6 [Nosema granulosis]
MNRVLRPYIGKFVMVYMDDIAIYSKTKEEHTRHIKQVLKIIEEDGLKLNKEKCEFGKKEIHILGHVINDDGVKIDPERVKSINKLEIQKQKKRFGIIFGNDQLL